MPRRPRTHLDNVPLHIVQRSHNREPCFFAASKKSDRSVTFVYLCLSVTRLLAKELLGYSEQGLAKAVGAGELIEVNDDGKA